ncbi:hypothetical protein J2T57_003656 [Natronocella acetinitrilica]|uniref:Uncharacterized protein n=1 Tax=Natronocella acetinitrilica TaxID=414046 RepID=A0AAE3G5W9_9GAMM|nr:hypothetical protein [Natronocella acetinitrilica]
MYTCVMCGLSQKRWTAPGYANDPERTRTPVGFSAERGIVRWDCGFEPIDEFGGVTCLLGG